MIVRKIELHALLLFLLLQPNTSLDTITSSNTLRDAEGDLLVSSGNAFALGFFSPSNSSGRYVGIWYYKPQEKTVVWVANREGGLNGTYGVLSIDPIGNLVLQDEIRSFPIWSTNVSFGSSNHSTAAQLLDSGNLVLIQGSSGRVVWQSFDYPTDTFLPSMKLGLDRTTGLNRILKSWKSESDPAPGSCSYSIDPTGYPQLFLYKNQAPHWRAGSWTGTRWSGIPEMTNDFVFHATFVNNATDVFITYNIINASIISRLVVDESGLLKRLAWHDQYQRWTEFWYHPKEQCDFYSKCGPNGNCDPYSTLQFECKCMPGFNPKSPGDWYLRDGSGGCIRRQGASMCQSGEGFIKLAHVKVPDTSRAVADMSLSLKECEQECLRNCSCTAYSSANQSKEGVGCLTWYGDLVDTRVFSDIGQDLYVRVDATDLANFSKGKRLINRKAMVAIVVVSAALLLLLLGLFSYQLLLKKRRARRNRGPLISVPMSSTYSDKRAGAVDQDSQNTGNTDLPIFEFSIIALATDNFSSVNELGHGGFGSVYKGVMKDGKEIAVKRLSKSSVQGIEEFKNEVRVIAKLQHRNLVKLLGCCIQEDEKLLIYEYLPNKGLDSFLFDEKKRSLLDWSRRFEIACGVARGLLYLHQDSRLRIIHRDLKASNILLDEVLNPKISDFGMARICREDQIEGNTKRVVGTYGYMSPEYAMEGAFSIKSDVYSFGVLLLEIITGRRNSGYYHLNPSSNLIGHVWELWKEGRCIEIVDESMGDLRCDDTVLRCVQIALLCVQEFAFDRPTMSTVVFMLGNMDVPLPSPKHPAFVFKRDYNVADKSSSTGTGSVNDITVTMIEGR